MKIQPRKGSLAIVGYTVVAAGLAVLVLAFSFWIFAFIVWIGASLDKQSFDAGTIVLPVVLSVAGVALSIAGAGVVRMTNRSDS
jgi:hypothetical protein